MVQRVRYTPDGAPIDSYRAAAESWDGRYGSALAQARNWRLISLLQLAIMLLLSGAVIWAFQLRTEVPYVVVLDERGETAQLKVADREYSPTELQISYHIKHFIEWVRSRPLDPTVFSRNWQQAYAFMNRDAQLKMNQFAAKYRPEEGLGDIARDVQVLNVRLRGQNTYEVRWHEEEWQDGSRLTEADYTGTFVVDIEPPTTGDDILENPMGLYIVEFGWSADRPIEGAK